MTDKKRVEDLENRIDDLESMVRSMLPSRRDALKLGVAGVAGASLMSGTASAGSSQVGTIGSAGNLVDIESEDITNADTITTQTLDSTTVNNSGTVTTQDIVVNGNAIGPFGGGGVVLEAGDSITVATLDDEDQTSFSTLYNGAAKDVLGGTIAGGPETEWIYYFSDGTQIRKDDDPFSQALSRDDNFDGFEVSFLPPAKSVTNIQVSHDSYTSNQRLGATAILKDI